jgi:hypothetical protein
LAFNRDERRDRAVALRPGIHAIGHRRALMPIDGFGGGTWIAATDAGVVFALLNVNDGAARVADDDHDVSDRVSRGRVIPRLVDCATPDAAMAEARRIDWSPFAPFRLLAVSLARGGEARWTGRRLIVRSTALGVPLMRTSSGLGDALVQQPRARLFRRLVRNAPDALVGQERFHHHQWPDRPHISVLMSRPDARTVSITIVGLTSTGAVMRYRDLDDPEGSCYGLLRESAA